MDGQRFKDAYDRLNYLDDRLTHKIHRRERARLRSPNLEQVDESLKDVGEYVVELKEIMKELFLAIGSKGSKSTGG